MEMRPGEVLERDGEFWVASKPNEYRVTVKLEATASREIQAESLEAALAAAKDWCDEMLDDPTDYVEEIDEITYTDRPYAIKTRSMSLVMRDGQPMRVSHRVDGDIPREPDERGF